MGSPEPVHRHDYQPPAFLVDDIALTFDLDAQATRVHSELHLRRNPRTTAAGPLHLDGVSLDLRTLGVDGVPLPASAFALGADGLTIHSPPEVFTLTTEVVLNPSANTALMGLYRAGPILCTQCEPEAFRRITFFPDRPDVLARFRVTLCGDATRYPVMLSNGNPVERQMLPDGRHRVVWDDPWPKPCYLFALVAGDLQRAEAQYTTVSGRAVDVHLYVEPHNLHCCDHALDVVQRAMAWDESRYGREYDLDVFNMVAVSAYTMGAMENKGLNIFNDRYVLADPDSAIDGDLRAIEALVAHEYFHNWTGNRITCRDWFQLGLKEGLTVFREQQFVADQGWADVRRIEDARLMCTRQFMEDAGPMAHAVRPDAYYEVENFFTDTVYSKGAELVRMLATLLGEDAFNAGMALFFLRYDGQAVTAEQFIACMAEAADRDLGQFLRWYDQRGTPELRIAMLQADDPHHYGLQVEQHLPDGGEPLHIPLAVGLLGEQGLPRPMELISDSPQKPATRHLLELRERQQTFWFSGGDGMPLPALREHFSAPVRIAYPYTAIELQQLALAASDAVVRWDAVQRLIHRAVRGRIQGDRTDSATLAATFAGLLDAQELAPGVVAELLALPDETVMARALEETDLDALIAARRWLYGYLAAELEPRLWATYRVLGRDTVADYHPQAVGVRALRNVCLGLIVEDASPEALALCHDQYASGPTMTDRVAALELLTHTQTPACDDALADFQRRCRRHPFLVDRWLSVQARSRRPDTLERVLALLDDPVFSIAQPNRVRSLVEAFCAGNPMHFHRADGAGYRLLAEQISRIDPVNPPLAAGLSRYLADTDWVGRERQALLREQLERIAALASLSEGTREVVSAALSRPSMGRAGN